MKFNVVKLYPAVQAFQIFALSVPVGTTREDLENPECYTEMTSRLSLMDLKPFEYPHIHITDEEGNFFAEVVVVSNYKQKIKCKILNFTSLVDEAADDVEEPDETEQQLKEPDTTAQAGGSDAIDPEANADILENAKDTEEVDDVAALEPDATVETEEEEVPEVETEETPVYSDDAFEKLKDVSLSHYVKWGGPANKWQIIDSESGDTLDKGLDKETAFAEYYTYG